MNGESTKQQLATAIGTVIIPMVLTEGIDDGPLLAFLVAQAQIIIWNLEDNIANGGLKRKQP